MSTLSETERLETTKIKGEREREKQVRNKIESVSHQQRSLCS